VVAISCALDCLPPIRTSLKDALLFAGQNKQPGCEVRRRLAHRRRRVWPHPCWRRFRFDDCPSCRLFAQVRCWPACFKICFNAKPGRKTTVNDLNAIMLCVFEKRLFSTYAKILWALKIFSNGEDSCVFGTSYTISYTSLILRCYSVTSEWFPETDEMLDSAALRINTKRYHRVAETLTRISIVDPVLSFRWDISVIFLLRHFGHLSHSLAKTRYSSVH